MAACDDIEKSTRAILAELLPAAQHGMVRVFHGTRGGYGVENKYSRKGDPLLRLAKAHKIDSKAYRAGDRLAKLATWSGIYAPSGMVIMERVGGSTERKMSEAQVAAWEEYYAASRAMLDCEGLEAMKLAINVAVYGHAPTACFWIGIGINRRNSQLEKALHAAADSLFPKKR